MSDLEHHGVKGMHWGQRLNRSAFGRLANRNAQNYMTKQRLKGKTMVLPTARSSAKQIAKADKKWERNAIGAQKFIEIHNSAADRMNGGLIKSFNNRPEFKGKTFPPGSEAERKYHEAYSELFMKTLNEQSKKIAGVSPSGKTLHFQPDLNGNLNAFIVDKKSVSHADGDIRFVLTLDNNRRIVSMKPVINITHMMIDIGEDFLEHFGIKGMHWGVRRERASDGKVRGPSKSTRDGISTDAARAKESHAIVKSHGTDALSNQDLQHLVSRMNLEQQYSKLTSGKSNVAKVKKGQGYIKEAIGVALMAKQVHEIANSPMVKDIKTVIDKAKKGG